MRALALLPILLLAMPLAVGAAEIELGMPLDCTIGENCFVQQYPDLDPGPGAKDPWCGSAAYDGHDGIDIRAISMPDILDPGIPVIAAAGGTVLGTRDGVPDHIVASDADREAVAGVECGNGLAIDNGDGWDTQYCHMRQGSIAVQSGDVVEKGQVLGYLGASGLAQFPHLHLTVRHNGSKIDPGTGRLLDAGCVLDTGTDIPLWEPAVATALDGKTGEVLDMGFAGTPIDHASLTRDGPPPEVAAGAENFVGWAWFINLRRGDLVELKMTDATGRVFAENRLDPLEANKADYSAFIGKRDAPPAGTYTLLATVTRDGAVAIERQTTITID